MSRKAITVFGILVILLVAMFGTVAAQGEEPETPPTTTTTDLPGSKFFTHPVVKLLSEYFDREVEDEKDTAVTGDPSATSDVIDVPATDATASGLGPIGEEIAAYHEDGMGFGVLVKLYAMAEASQEACKAEAEKAPVAGAEACTPLTAEELITSFKEGTGMGLLFQEHGKPALLGVGHVKQELKKLEEEKTADDTQVEPGTETETETDTTLNTQNNNKNDNKGTKPLKTRPNNGKGPKK
jgi:hypothetical protein